MVIGTLRIDDKDFYNSLNIKMDELADQIFADSQNNIVTQKIIDEGTLLKSGVIERSYLKKTIAYRTPYADVIEFGRNPGSMPPLEPLKAWIKRKGLERKESRINSFAWAIAQDIKKNGTEPRPYLGPAVEKAKNNI